MTNAIETTNLTRRFGRLEAVDHLTLQVPSGSVYALVGPNGAGKTTTIKLLLNLIRPTQGAARVLGVDSSRLDVPALQRIGYVSENQHLPDHLTTQGLLDYCKPFYPSWDDGLARRLRATLNVPAETRLKNLSRGTRMKAALLSALAFRPDLLVLDEPFSGLDPLVRDELVHGLLELAERTSVDRVHLVSRHRGSRAHCRLGGVPRWRTAAVCGTDHVAAAAVPVDRSDRAGPRAAGDRRCGVDRACDRRPDVALCRHAPRFVHRGATARGVRWR